MCSGPKYSVAPGHQPIDFDYKDNRALQDAIGLAVHSDSDSDSSCLRLPPLGSSWYRYSRGSPSSSIFRSSARSELESWGSSR